MSGDDGFILQLLTETREELVRADNKANIILASAGVVIGALIAGAVAGDVSLTEESFAVWLLSGLAGIMLLSGIVNVGLAVRPHLGEPEVGRARYFSEVAQYHSATEAREPVLQEAQGAEARHMDQLHALSRLVQSKFERTRRAMTQLCVGFAASGLAGLLSKIT